MRVSFGTTESFEWFLPNVEMTVKKAYRSIHLDQMNWRSMAGPKVSIHINGTKSSTKKLITRRRRRRQPELFQERFLNSDDISHRHRSSVRNGSIFMFLGIWVLINITHVFIQSLFFFSV